MTLYLKYRPQTLDQLVGQEVVKNTLLSAFSSNKLAHAYLFVGPRGTGKTSTARILAKMVNCLASSSSGAPCNKCDGCISITDGSNLDLIEVDAASNRGIDDIRSLREKIKLAPTSSKKKIYIIDEVHMLTTEAFNALLKTLEEPPAHVLFILATTEEHKVPKTILSRVQRLEFKLASVPELIEALERVARGEEIEVDQEALLVVAKQAEGSFRDAVKLLDQLASTSSGKITKEQAISELKSTSFEGVIKLLAAFVSRDTKAGLLQVQQMLESGANIKDLMLGIMDNMRSLVFIKSKLGDSLVKPELSEDKYQQLVQLGDKLELAQVVKGLDVLQSAVEKLKTASIASLPLELAVVEICEELSNIQSPVLSSQDQVQVVQHLNTSPSQDQDLSKIAKTENPSSVKASDDVTSPAIALLQEKWTFVLESIKPYNFSLEALLRHVKIKEVSKGSVVLEVPYSFHQRILEAPKSRDLLESVMADVLGQQVRISCVLTPRPTTIEELANVEVAADDEIVKIASEIFNSDN